MKKTGSYPKAASDIEFEVWSGCGFGFFLSRSEIPPMSDFASLPVLRTQDLTDNQALAVKQVVAEGQGEVPKKGSKTHRIL